jgi:hypothetical protein
VGCPTRHAYSVLLPVRFALPLLSPAPRWALTPPFHPYLFDAPGIGYCRTLRAASRADGSRGPTALTTTPAKPRRSVLCGTFSRFAPGGRYPPPFPVEPGLSSRRRPSACARRCARHSSKNEAGQSSSHLVESRYPNPPHYSITFCHRHAVRSHKMRGFQKRFFEEAQCCSAFYSIPSKSMTTKSPIFRLRYFSSSMISLRRKNGNVHGGS